MDTTQVDLSQTFAENERDIALAWLKFTIERFQGNLRRLKIGSSEELFKSFQGELVSAAGGDELKLRLSYAIQGVFVDLGVGRGMGAGITKGYGKDYYRLRNERGQLHRHQRRAKRWYSKQMANEQHQLSRLVSELWGKVALAQISTATPVQPLEITF